MRTNFYSDTLFQKHDTGGHPENSGRLQAIAERIAETDWAAGLHPQPARPATKPELQLIHGPDYIGRVEDAALAGLPYMDTPDCVLSRESYTVALHAAGTLVEAVDAVHGGRADNAFAACRPPGHHAEQMRAMGFCFFNNVAIAAAHLLENLGYERVLVFDFDVHHGNGTQHSFEERRELFFASMHQHPATLYPGTGFAEEKGRGTGLGYTLNVPMEPGSGDAAYLHAFENRLLPAFREFDPQFVLISAGFDAHRADPLAQQSMTREGFDALITHMKTLAEEHCQGRLVSALEGGYDYTALADCVVSHLGILQADPA